MKHATLRQLKVFEAVARLLSFSRAAEELHLTQPAVSTQVRKLEDHAGNTLFEQFGKKVYLTAAGTELLQLSRAIIQQFEAAENAMLQFKGISGGKLNVGVISAGDYFFPRLLVEFAGRHRGGLETQVAAGSLEGAQSIQRGQAMAHGCGSGLEGEEFGIEKLFQAARKNRLSGALAR